MIFTINSINSLYPVIRLSRDTARDFLIDDSYKTLVVSYGQRNTEVQVEFDSNIEKSCLELNIDVINKLLIDTNIKYEIHLKNNELIIGPVIGLLLGKKEKVLKRQLDDFLIYTRLYSQINGAICIFSEEQIDFVKEEITGYVFDKEQKSGHWRKNKFPFPGAIFRRVGLSTKTLQLLNKKTNNNVFNASYFNKWEFWKLTQLNEELISYIPETSEKININNLNIFLSKYDGVYLKPKDGSRGKEIIYIRKKDNIYEVHENYKEEVLLFSDSLIEDFLCKRKYYLFQQPIDLKTYNGRKVDYRTIIQKDENGNWICSGIIGRFGENQGITSNFRRKGFAKNGLTALQMQFNISEKKAYQIYEKMIEVSLKFADYFEKAVGLYADLGIDIGIDEQGKIWVIEINKRHDHDFPLLIQDREMYYKVKSNPILFAKKLAMKK